MDWTVLGDRAHDYLFRVLPAVFWAVYEFAKEWQILIAALVVLGAARYFFDAMLRSSRMTGEAVIRAARIAGDAASPAPKSAPDPVPLLGQDNLPAGGSAADRLEALRSAVRAALAAIPTSGNEIGIKGAALYGRVSTITLDDIDPAMFGHSALGAFRELQTALDSLRLDSGNSDARQAWERLVRINKLARELRAKIAPENPLPLAKAIVKKIG